MFDFSDNLPLLRNGIEEFGHAGSEGFAGELADGVSLVVFGENLVQFGLSGMLHLDIFLVIGSIELVQHILTYAEIEALSSQLLPEFGRFSSLRVRGCGPPLI